MFTFPFFLIIFFCDKTSTDDNGTRNVVVLFIGCVSQSTRISPDIDKSFKHLKEKKNKQKSYIIK